MIIENLKPGQFVQLRHKTHGSFQGVVQCNDRGRQLLSIEIQLASKAFRKSCRVWIEGNHFAWKNLEVVATNGHGSAVKPVESIYSMLRP